MSINEEIDILRLKATSSLLARKDVIVVSSVSCIYGIGSPAEYQEQVIQVQKSIHINRRAIFRKLVNIHYNRIDAGFERGTFRVRGDIIEIYLAYEDIGVRLEMFGDTIDSISRFNPLTGEVLKEMANEFINPAKHFVTDQQSIKYIVSDIREELTQRLEELRSDGGLLEAQRLEQ